MLYAFGTVGVQIIKGAVKKAQQSPWISSIWKPTGFNISHSKKAVSYTHLTLPTTERV